MRFAWSLYKINWTSNIGNSNSKSRLTLPVISFYWLAFDSFKLTVLKAWIQFDTNDTYRNRHHFKLWLYHCNIQRMVLICTWKTSHNLSQWIQSKYPNIQFWFKINKNPKALSWIKRWDILLRLIHSDSCFSFCC